MIVTHDLMFEQDTARRHLLLLDHVSDGYKAGFAIFAAVTFLCACVTIDMSLKRAHYKENKIIKYLFPLALFILTYINLVMIFGSVIPHDGAIAISIFVLQPIVVPILLLLTFERTYVLHKRRSVNFCGIQFDEGRRLKINFKDWLLRNLVRIISGSLIAISVVANFAIVGEGNVADGHEALSVGWQYVFNTEISSKDTIAQSVRAFMSLIPVSILVLANIYFAFVMWLYGSYRSMIIHSTYLNPWISLLFGTLTLAVTQILGGTGIYPLTSALGYVVLVISILILMVEVDKDMQAAAEFSDFLSGIAPHNITSQQPQPQQRLPAGGGAKKGADAKGGGGGGTLEMQKQGTAKRVNDTMTHDQMVAVKSMEVQL